MAFTGCVDERFRRHGRGTYVYPNRLFKYTGTWSQGIKEGPGVLTLGDGSSIEANFVNGEINGQGLRRWPDGATYSGNFSYGEFNGHGELVKPNGERYVGDFKANQRHGEGEFVACDGTVYQGSFANHLKSGNGVEYYNDESVFYGTWLDNEKHGEGKLEFPSGELLTGTWFNGVLGNANFVDQNAGFEYNGAWGSNGEPIERAMSTIHLQFPDIEQIDEPTALSFGTPGARFMFSASYGTCNSWSASLLNNSSQVPPETGRIFQITAQISLAETDDGIILADFSEGAVDHENLSWRDVRLFVPKNESVESQESLGNLSQVSVTTDPGLDMFLGLDPMKTTTMINENGVASFEQFKISDGAPAAVYRIVVSDVTEFGNGSRSQGFVPCTQATVILQLDADSKGKKKKKKKKKK